LLDHFQRVRDVLEQQRADLADWQSRLDLQHADLHSERETLKQWLSDQDAELRQRADALQAEAAEYDAREQAWQALRDRWLREKIEAEEVIRELLRRMGTPA
jgi:hypothetical protein